MTLAPSINCDRVTLRAHRVDDFAPMQRWLGDSWARYMGGPFDRDEAWRMFAADVGSWPLLGFGAWAVDLRDTGETIGQVGVNKPVHFPEIELGWMIYPDHEGKGLAFEAAKAARDWAFGPGGLDMVVSYIHRDNARSQALAKRLGAVEDSAAPRADGDTVDDTAVFRHHKGAA